VQDIFASGIDVVVIVRRPLEQRKLGDVLAEWRGAASVVERRSSEAKGDRLRRASAPSAAEAKA
jgi:hypothetical protein